MGLIQEVPSSHSITSEAAVRAAPLALVNLQEIWDGIAHGEFRPHFQPVISLRDMSIIGAETLMRWDHPRRGMVPAGEFLPLIEDNFLFDELSALMLERSILQCQIWRAAGINLPVSVNLSEDLLLDAKVVSRLAQRMTELGVPPDQLTIEVTETAIAHNLNDVLENIVSLRTHGFGVAIDDFGTGHCAPSLIERLPVTALKVHRMVVGGAAERPHLRRLLETSLDLSRELNIPAVAVGVESQAQWELVQLLGFDAAQGFLLGRPMPGQSLSEFHECWSSGAVV